MSMLIILLLLLGGGFLAGVAVVIWLLVRRSARGLSEGDGEEIHEEEGEREVMASTTIGQVVIVEGRRAVICKRYDFSRPRFGVIFFDDHSGHLLHEDEWIVTGETISQAKAKKLFAAHDRAAQKYIMVEQERRLRRRRDWEIE